MPHKGIVLTYANDYILVSIFILYIIYHHEDNIRRVQFHNQGVEKYVTCLKEFLDNPRLEFSSVFNIIFMANSVIGDPEDTLSL